VIEVTPTEAGEVAAWIVKDGYDLHGEVFPIVTQPSAHGTVTLVGEPDHSGVVVTAEPGGYATVTGADGTWHLLNLEEGSYQLTAAKDGWSTGYAEITVGEGEHITGIDFTLSVVYTADACVQPELPIPDPPVGEVVSTQTCAESGTIDWVRVYVDVEHDWIGQLQIELTSPQGTSVLLHDRTGQWDDDVVGWYPDALEPAEDLAAFIGENLHGDWSLTVRDEVYGIQGVLGSWCLEIGYAEVTVPVEDRELPTRVALGANYPNPFNPMTTIAFELPRATGVQLRVYDLRGKLVATLAEGMHSAGRHEVVWSGRDTGDRQVASGMYVYRLVTDERTLSRKMLLVK
jgi:subtilisin-like proprotein convertase family protein